MTTPRGANHRDLEQRLRDMEQQLRTLTGELLRREQLEVTEGDFVVSGGGNVVVRDSGQLRIQYPGGSDTAVAVGDIYAESDGSYMGTGVLVQDASGVDTFKALDDSVTIERTDGKTALWVKAGIDEHLTLRTAAGDTPCYMNAANGITRGDHIQSELLANFYAGVQVNGDVETWGRLYLRAQQGIDFGTGARITRVQDFGLDSVTLDANGYGWITHGLAGVPDAVDLTSASHYGNPTIWQWDNANSDADNIRVRCTRYNGTPEANTARTVSWTAVRS